MSFSESLAEAIDSGDPAQCLSKLVELAKTTRKHAERLALFRAAVKLAARTIHEQHALTCFELLIYTPAITSDALSEMLKVLLQELPRSPLAVKVLVLLLCRCRLAVACFDVCIEEHRDALTAISNNESYDFVSRLQLGGCLRATALRALHLAALRAGKCVSKHTQADGSDLPCCFQAVSFQVGDKPMVHACTPVYLLQAFPCWRMHHDARLANLNSTPALLKTGKFTLYVKQMSCSCILL